MKFCHRLQYLRRDKNVSQEEVGKALGLNSLIIELFESSKVNPSPHHLVELARYFDVSVDYLVCNVNLKDPYRILR